MLLSGTKNLEVAPRFLENLCTLVIVVSCTYDGYYFLQQIDLIKYVVPGDDIVEHCMMLRLGEA